MATLLLDKQQKSDRDALIEALYRTAGKAEIVNEEIIEFMATGVRPGYAGDDIYAALRQYAKQHRSGFAVGDNKGFVVNLPNRGSFSPDAACRVGSAPPMKFYDGAPLFAVEVRSEGDYGLVAETEMRDKRADYFAAGTEVVWDVDVLSETATVRVFTKTGGADEPSAIFGREDTADVGPALPGWMLVVADLFPFTEGHVEAIEG